jgi:hypothetical protein
VAVDVLPDALDELTEDLTVTIASSAPIADASGRLTITDDDAEPTVSVGDVVLDEGQTTRVACPSPAAVR